MSDLDIERMKFLIKKLNDAAFNYYNLDNEIMTDYEYDKLYDELLNLEKKNNIILDNSPSQKIGAKIINGLKKIRHEKKMLSLDKTKDINKLKDFLGDKIGLLSFKLDGLTIVLEYNNNILKKIITRGNGEIGEDVTHNFYVFDNLPKKISYDKKLVIRGEAVMSYKNFDELNYNNKDNKYKNPRNLCSGIVRNLSPKKMFRRLISFFAFELISLDDLSLDLDFCNSKQKKLEWLESLGFDVIKYKMTDINKICEDANDFIYQAKKFDFGSDGLVLTFDNISYSNSLGVTNKFPRDSIAFKWKDKIIKTRLLNVEWNTSRTGLINPVAVFEPVELDGTEINKASLHNINFIENLELGINDEIEVYKANMIIPQVADNLTRSNNIKIPDKCPVCNHKTQISKINNTKFLFCSNSSCQAKLIMSLVHFVSRDAMNIGGLSEMLLKKFVDYGFIKYYYDIYGLKNYEQEIKFYKILDSNSPNKNHKLYENLISSIEKSRSVYLYNFIYALGINHVGLSNAKNLCLEFNYDINKILTPDLDKLKNIYGFGDAISESIYNYFCDHDNILVINKLLKELDLKKPDLDLKAKNNKNKILDGLCFVITGDINKFKNRKELVDLIESLGGRVSSSVSSKTNFLINNNPDSKSSKNLKANELGVNIISESDFIKKFGLEL